jgi:hypothetical protein
MAKGCVSFVRGRISAMLHAVDQARKGNILFLVDYLEDSIAKETRVRGGGDPLEKYLLDVLLHKVRVPKPRPAQVEAHHEYRALAGEMALLQFAGASSEQATCALDDGADQKKHSKLERARRRFRLRHQMRLARACLAYFDDPERAEEAFKGLLSELFPDLEKAGGTK